jgi:hypothetical protein
MIKQISKRMIIVVFLAIFIQGNILFSETNGQAFSRAQNLMGEWNSLVRMSDSLTGASKALLYNYMMGFAEGAYLLCEYVHNLGFSDFSYEIDFFFDKFQRLMQFDVTTTNSYAYHSGKLRSGMGEGRRMGISDFR